jgi:hypothetical protein
MKNFPTSAKEFYELRDDRTNRCSPSRKYQDAVCEVHLSPVAAPTAAAQMMLLVATNILSRWCRKVTIVMPPTDVHPALGMGSGNLGELVVAQMRDADPFGDFQTALRGNVTAQVALYIGGNSQGRPSSAKVFINASGWLASVSTQQPIGLPTSEDNNWLGAIAAACLGIAQVFKIAVELPSTHYVREGIFDVFRLDWSQESRQAPWPANLNVGNVLMVGAGSVGSSAAYCMRLSGLTGAISIVDKDIVKIENFNRSPVFGRRTVGLTKADALADFLTESTLSARAIPLWWNEFVRERERSSFDFDVWLPLANEYGVRLAMQHSVPPLMIHASTTLNWGVNHGRHIPGRDDCLADRFPVEVSSDKLMCATGQIEASEMVMDAALPFASLFAGLLIVADLIRAQLPEYPHVPNFALFDWYGPLDIIQAWDRKPRTGCICREQGQGFHERFNSNTKYRRLFRFGVVS